MFVITTVPKQVFDSEKEEKMNERMKERKKEIKKTSEMTVKQGDCETRKFLFL